MCMNQKTISIHAELKLRVNVAVEALITFFLVFSRLKGLDLTLMHTYSICRPVPSTNVIGPLLCYAFPP